MKTRLYLYTALILFLGLACSFAVSAYIQYLPVLVITVTAAGLICLFLIRRMVSGVMARFGEAERQLRLTTEAARVLRENADALRDRENKLDYILNNVGDGLFAVDEDKNVALINAAALDIFNVTPDIVNKNLNYLTYNQTLAGALEDCITRGGNALTEVTINGRIFSAAVKPLPDTRLAMGVLSDVTESRENAKRREEFFANASHELKTPLTAIKGFNELTALNNTDENLRKYIDGIARETGRMLALIGDMLRLSELENTRAARTEPVPLEKIVEEAREAVSALIAEKSITFEARGGGVVTAEPEHVYELVRNLVENAVRYNSPGGKVSVRAESGGGPVRLTVSDNGIGIQPEEQPRIFERFYRVEKSRSQRNGGTGLGLSIVKHICALYGWALSLKSKPGVGTEITVTFLDIS